MFVGRQEEQSILKSALDAENSQFIAVYGRRRVGKTFLIRETFGFGFTFQHAGLANGSLKEQLFAFASSLKDAGMTNISQPTSWLEAFELLKDLVRASDSPKKVIFIDELSWMDTPKSSLMTALEAFWNGWASGRKDIVLIVCASATSWMLNKVVHNKGGLYNRLTRQIHLKPFCLSECRQLADAKGIVMNDHQLLECYMILGGVPYYWDLLQKGLSLPQNIDRLFFSDDAPLAHEYDYLFSSLFREPEGYLAIVKALATSRSGLLRKDIAAKTGMSPSGHLTKCLTELESCGFIRSYCSFGNKSKGTMFQLIDNFVLFHFKFLTKPSFDEHFWSNQINTPAHNTWCGLAFERVCLEHVAQIKRALGITGVLTDINSWSCSSNPDAGIHGSQIDLLIVRKDQVINVCEMKYSATEFAITKDVDEDMRHKLEDFRSSTGTRSALHITLVTPYGLRQNSFSGSVQAVVTAADLLR